LIFFFISVIACCVQILNASCNLPIYLFVGKSFRTSFIKLFGLKDLVAAWEKSRGKLNTCGL
jgi:hypothetical protein